MRRSFLGGLLDDLLGLLGGGGLLGDLLDSLLGDNLLDGGGFLSNSTG